MSIDLLLPTEIYKLNSGDVMHGLYYLPSVPYFGKYHCPYATLALMVLFVSVSVPTIILFCSTLFIFFDFLFHQLVFSLHLC